MTNAILYRKKKVAFDERWRNHVTCSKCGVHPYYEGHKMGINFHHLDPSTKSFEVNITAVSKNDLEIMMEIAKCMPLCATCHNIAHHDKGKSSMSDNIGYQRARWAEHREENNAKKRAYRAKRRLG